MKRRAVPLKFLTVGIVNTAVGLLIIYVCKFVFNMDDVPANAFGYGIGIALSFSLNKDWTFGYKGPTAQAIFRFAVIFAFAYGLNIGTVLTLVELCDTNSYLAQAFGIVPYTVVIYGGSRMYAFADTAASTRS
jgi:putative flippase GtrA